MLLIAGFVGARFGRLMGWPFPPPNARALRQNMLSHDLSNGLFWAILTSLIVSSGVTIIEHI
jgi:hypothetical protein